MTTRLSFLASVPGTLRANSSKTISHFVWQYRKINYCHPLRKRQIQPTNRQETHIQARRSSHTLRAASPVLPHQRICVHSLLRRCKQSNRLRKCGECASAISHTQHRATQQHTHIRQSSPHLVRKKFRKDVAMSDCEDHRGFGHFEEAAWCTRNGKSQHVVGLAGQGVYLTWGCLVQGFGHSPWEPGPASSYSRFSAWSGKSANSKACDLQTPQSTPLTFWCCSCLCAQIRRAPKIFWCTCENTPHR